MEAAQKIRDAVHQVSLQRQQRGNHLPFQKAADQIKGFQARRFAGTYADLLKTPPYREAVLFFLEELYGARDFEQRDLQFARIAGALERIFPKDVVATAVALAELHALTEELDSAMARAWISESAPPSQSESLRYVTAWREVARSQDRYRQLSAVLELGRELDGLTRTPGLRLMLRMMRGPASAAGLSDLQRFLESGFDNFSVMARQPGCTREFLSIVEHRETRFIESISNADVVTCVTELETTLGQAR